MLVLCYGIPKSGSTLAFELVKGMLQSAGFEQEFFVNDRIDSSLSDTAKSRMRNYVERVTSEKLDSLLLHTRSGRKTAVKTHSPFPLDLYPRLEALQASGELRVIASYRDPREICLSLTDAAEKARNNGGGAFAGVTDLQKAQRNVATRIKEFRKWASLKGTLRLGYNMVAFSPEDAIDRIETALDIRCDRAVAMDYAFNKASTQKNKIKKDRYRDELSPSQNADMLQTFGTFIHQVCEKDDQGWFEECRDEMLAALRPARA